MSTWQTSWRETIGIVALAGALSGCGDARIATAPVHGIVTVDGQPLPQGRVMLAPIPGNDAKDPGPAAYGVIQPDGTFVLGTFADGDGAVVGRHWMTLYGEGPQSERRLPGAPAGASTSSATAWPAHVPKFKKMKLPRDPFEVAAGVDNRLVIILTSDDIRRYGEQDD